ncbi:MAG: hypothetical protein QNJ70_01425 [Xenococcaceae cyanobacterium MO_207.B15]|nr:hypothetical protein [Xenococcaceae cyanobacterium MO_207.B15]
MKTINLFFEIPDGDRWIPFDRYPRKIIRSIVRHNQPIAGGYRRSFRGLCKGLERLNIPYKLNDYRHIRKHPSEIACVYGYPHVLSKIDQNVPIIFGAGGYSHPIDNPNLLREHNIKKILVKGQWMVKMCAPFWGNLVQEWAAPIDTEYWIPNSKINKDIDFLIYDKVRWNYEQHFNQLINPIQNFITARNLTFQTIKYGQYIESELKEIAHRSKAMIFLCEHETQGLAYQNVLATNTPILAWDRGGSWQDPKYFPERVKFETVTSVPYWDNRCGLKFQNIEEFADKLDQFLDLLNSNQFAPRDYILENLTWEKCAQNYLDILKSAQVNKDYSLSLKV